MQKNRKLFSTAIVTLLLLSIVASAAPAFAQVDVFTVNPTTATGTVGSMLTLTYTHASYGGQVIVYWETQAGAILYQTYADGAGAATAYVFIPSGAAGPHAIVARDVSTGSTATTTYTIIPKITLTPSNGLVGDSVTVTGTGFTRSGILDSLTFAGSDITPATTVSISTIGEFVATFTVPNLIYGTYSVVATDNATLAATATFIIGATFTASESKGPTGTVITVTGRGFTPSTDITWRIFRDLDAEQATVPEVVNIQSTTTGTFTGRIVVPTVAKSGATTASVYKIEATDGSNAPTVRFNVTATTVFVVDPMATSPWQNTVVTITGSGYTQLSGTEVTFTFNGVPVGTLTTTATGAVVGEIAIPNLSAAYYDFVGTDAFGLTYTLSYQIGITLLVLNYDVGPTGLVVTYYAYGFHNGLAINVTLNGMVVDEIANPTNVGGRITSTFQIPTMPIGTYEVKVTATDGLNAIKSFTVNATTAVSPNPAQAPILSNIYLTATNFGSSTVLSFYIFNSTWGTELTMVPSSGFSSTVTNGSGLYIGYFAVPSSWTNGLYTIVVNNTANTLNATTTFTVGYATFTVETRGSTYNQGDIVSFKISSSYYADEITITVTDPQGYKGYVWGETTELSGGLYNGYYYCSPCWEKFQLASDVPLGVWTWNATNDYGHVRTGSFTVTAKIGSVLSGMDSKLDTIISSIEDLNATLVDISGDMVTIKSGQTTITTSISNLPSSLTSTIQTSISSGLATISTSLGSITTELSSLKATINSIDADVVTLSTSVGVVLTTLDDIKAVVCDIQDDVATISTSVGEIKGTVTNIQGSIATINTGFGNIEMDISALQADVTSTKGAVDGMNAMVYIAAAFAVIAAIAAIASILLMRKKIAS